MIFFQVVQSKSLRNFSPSNAADPDFFQHKQCFRDNTKRKKNRYAWPAWIYLNVHISGLFKLVKPTNSNFICRQIFSISAGKKTLFYNNRLWTQDHNIHCAFCCTLHHGCCELTDERNGIASRSGVGACVQSGQRERNHTAKTPSYCRMLLFYNFTLVSYLWMAYSSCYLFLTH